MVSYNRGVAQRSVHCIYETNGLGPGTNVVILSIKYQLGNIW